MNRPLLLLIGTGAALGLNFPIGKMAMAAGVDPALWSAVISLGAGLAMLFAASLTEVKRPHAKSTFQFAIISGLISYVVPNFLTYSVIPKIGSGLAAIMFALSPVVTALISLMLRVRPPNLLGIAGIAVGLAGAVIIIFSRNADFNGSGTWWILAALLIPIFLGLGNVYRTMAWPEGASPRKLASHTNLAAVSFLVIAVFVQTGTIDLSPLTSIPGLVVAQLAVSPLHVSDVLSPATDRRTNLSQPDRLRRSSRGRGHRRDIFRRNLPPKRLGWSGSHCARNSTLDVGAEQGALKERHLRTFFHWDDK